MRQGLFRRWLRALGRRRDDRAMRLRHFDAARPSRATHGWPAPSSSVNLDLYAALPVLRDRGRDLARNNPHAAKAIASLVGNAIGAGIDPRPKTGDEKLDGEVDHAHPSPVCGASLLPSRRPRRPAGSTLEPRGRKTRRGPTKKGGSLVRAEVN